MGEIPVDDFEPRIVVQPRNEVLPHVNQVRGSVRRKIETAESSCQGESAPLQAFRACPEPDLEIVLCRLLDPGSLGHEVACDKGKDRVLLLR